jgi:hypothetical protein
MKNSKEYNSAGNCSQGRGAKNRPLWEPTGAPEMALLMLSLFHPQLKLKQQQLRLATVLECGAYVYLAIKIKKNGRIFTFNSDSIGEWLLPEA